MAYDFGQLTKAGITFEDAVQLRRISMTLHRWHELECGDSNNRVSYSLVRGCKTGKVFEYDDNGKPYMEYHYSNELKPSYFPVPDRERGALARLTKIMSNYPTLNAFIQTDPRGCALYIGEGLTDSNYNNGVAVYK